VPEDATLQKLPLQIMPGRKISTSTTAEPSLDILSHDLPEPRATVDTLEISPRSSPYSGAGFITPDLHAVLWSFSRPSIATVIAVHSAEQRRIHEIDGFSFSDELLGDRDFCGPSTMFAGASI
jgi:hypothetical protein